MDSKLIHIKANHLIRKASFDTEPLGGWLYCGRSDDFKIELVSELIEKHFTENKIYFALARHDSGITDKTQIISLITKIIDNLCFGALILTG